MPKEVLLTALLCVPAVMAAAGLWLTRKPGRPLGNVSGTSLERSEGLWRLNRLALYALVCACLVGLVLVHR